MRGYLVRADAHTIAVERMRLGDHAFAHYADDDVRWEVPAVFTNRGLSHGEKVIVMMDPGCSADDACERLAAFVIGVDDARDRGQLVFSSMRELISPEKSFTARRQTDRLRQETELARQEGFAGLRTVIDMAWVDDLGMDVEGVMKFSQRLQLIILCSNSVRTSADLAMSPIVVGLTMTCCRVRHRWDISAKPRSPW